MRAGHEQASGPAWRTAMLPGIVAAGPRATRENKEDITDAQDEIEWYSWNVTKVDFRITPYLFKCRPRSNVENYPTENVWQAYLTSNF